MEGKLDFLGKCLHLAQLGARLPLRHGVAGSPL